MSVTHKKCHHLVVSKCPGVKVEAMVLDEPAKAGEPVSEVLFSQSFIVLVFCNMYEKQVRILFYELDN